MKVQLIEYTGAGYADPARMAANILVFTKQTRLEMRQDLFDEVCNWPWEKVEAELEYMANTIPSSWEFINYTFLITDVTRAFTHQFVRTRTGSYAQQTMRVLNVEGWTYGTGPSLSGSTEDVYNECMEKIADTYEELIDRGAKIEDARGVLPTNIHTNIVAKFDLRTLADTARKRASSRTQGEYREVMEAMKAEVLRVQPWASMFFGRTFDGAAISLENQLSCLEQRGQISQDHRITMLKLLDQMRATA